MISFNHSPRSPSELVPWRGSSSSVGSSVCWHSSPVSDHECGSKVHSHMYIHVRTYAGTSICWTVIALHVVVYIVPQVSWHSPLCTSCAHPIRKEESSGLYYMTCLLNYLQRTRMHSFTYYLVFSHEI